MIRDGCAAAALLVAVFAFLSCGDPQAAGFASYWLGIASGFAWALSAGVPMYYPPARHWSQASLGLNLIAAISTAGAVVASAVANTPPTIPAPPTYAPHAIAR